MILDYIVDFREKDGSIQCTIRYKDHLGKWKTKSRQGFKTQKASKPWQNKTIKMLEKEIQSASKMNDEFAGITFEEFTKVFLKDVRRIRTYNTYVSYKKALEHFNQLNSIQIDKITFLDIKKVLDDWIDNKKFKTSTIKLYFSQIKRLFKVAKNEYKIIIESPLEKSNFNFPKEKKAKIKTLSRLELRELISLIESEKDSLITQVASAGLRVGEIVGLTWDCIDKKKQDFIINKQWKKLGSKHWGFGDTKSVNSDRRTPIPPKLFKDLLTYEKICIKNFDHRIFPEKTSSGVAKRLSDTYKKLGFDISIHDLRHTYATLLIADGVDFKTVAEFMGDTVEMIIRTYVHFNNDMYENGRKKVNSLY